MFENCPEFSNVESIRSQAITMGNSAHEVRNVLAMTKKADLPELIAVDTLAAQVENQARTFVQQSMNPVNLLKPETGKIILRSIFRTNNFILRNLKLDLKDLGYTLMSKEHLKILVEQVELQQRIVKSLDKQLNEGFSNYIYNGGDSCSVEVISKKEEFEELPLYSELDYSQLQMQVDSLLESLDLKSLIQSAKDTCNKAHSIQNAICMYQTIEKVKVSANQINNHAGNIENQFRAILQALGQQTNNPVNVKNIITNQVKAANEQITAIAPHFKTVSDAFPEVKDIQKSCDTISKSLSFFSNVANQKILEILS